MCIRDSATTAQLGVLGELGLDLAAAALQVDTIKAVFTAVAKSARVFACLLYTSRCV